MSNKTLIIAIVAILVVFGGVVMIMRARNNNQVNGTADSQQPAQPVSLNQQDQQPVNPAPSQPTSTPPAAATSTPATGTCKQDFNADKLVKNANISLTNRQVTINVKDFGNITLGFYDKDAPKAVENFLRLADAGYYDCLTFHRIGKSFMIQGGDPTGTGAGGQSAFGQAFADELNPDTPSYKTGYVKGVLAMANAGPNTNGSQFFILVANYPLDHNYTIFGHVLAGQDVADKISELATTNGGVGAPVTPVIMQSVKIIK